MHIFLDNIFCIETASILYCGSKYLKLKQKEIITECIRFIVFPASNLNAQTLSITDL